MTANDEIEELRGMILALGKLVGDLSSRAYSTPAEREQFRKLLESLKTNDELLTGARKMGWKKTFQTLIDNI